MHLAMQDWMIDTDVRMCVFSVSNFVKEVVVFSCVRAAALSWFLGHRLPHKLSVQSFRHSQHLCFPP